MKINLDINRSEPILETINLRQGDGGLRTIDIQITENNQPIAITGYTLQFEANLPSGSMVQHAGVIKDATAGLFSYTFTSSDTSEVGQLPVAYFRLYDSAKNSVATRNIRIVVDRAADITKAQAVDYLAEVNQLIDRTTTDLAANNQRIADQQAAVDAMSKGMQPAVTNLIYNGGDDPQNTDGWTGNALGLSGFRTAKHDFYAGGYRNLFVIVNESSNEAIVKTAEFKLKPSTQYTVRLSGFAAINSVSQDIFFGGRTNSGGTEVQFKQLFRGNFSTSNVEVKKYTFTTDANVAYGSIRFDNNGSTDGQGAAFYFGDIMLVEGTLMSSDYVHSPDDFLKQLSSQNARIAALEQAILNQ